MAHVCEEFALGTRCRQGAERVLLQVPVRRLQRRSVFGQPLLRLLSLGDVAGKHAVIGLPRILHVVYRHLHGNHGPVLPSVLSLEGKRLPPPNLLPPVRPIVGLPRRLDLPSVHPQQFLATVTERATRPLVHVEESPVGSNPIGSVRRMIQRELRQQALLFRRRSSSGPRARRLRRP